MEAKEIYPNAPVILAALEVRHPVSEPLSRSTAAQLKQLVGDELPLLRQVTSSTVEIAFTAGVGQSDVSTESAPKFFSRDGGTAMTFRRDAVVVETTRHDHFERLRDLALLGVSARQQVDPVDGVDRVGLRYIDEVRVPDASAEPSAWAPWVHQSLLGPASVGEGLGLTTTQMHGVMLFERAPGCAVALRWGPRVGYAVDPGGDLKRKTAPPGPFFLIDIDSFWLGVDETPPIDVAWLAATCDELHAPVRALFEGLITARLRDEVLRNGN